MAPVRQGREWAGNRLNHGPVSISNQPGPILRSSQSILRSPRGEWPVRRQRDDPTGSMEEMIISGTELMIYVTELIISST